ncbi:MAG: hypothetical protein LQ342_003403 [Letrouitia transgressa]|nr:MAG: hypothetical protein LQ342_003403 [Letrouitia transgressa]
MRLRIRIGAVMLLVTYLATVLTIIFSCYPLHRHWQIYPDPGNACQTAIATIEVAVLLAMNISTDLYLMSVPLPMIWKSRLAMKKKWVLSIMFSGGILIIVAGILRCVLILTAGANGPALAGEWSIRESFIAVMVNNLPMLYTLYQRIAQSDLFSQSRNLSGKSSGRGSYPLGSYRTGESGKASKKGKKFQHPLSMPNDTAMGSDERIVVNPNNPHATGGYEPPVGEKPAQLGPYTTNAEDERNKAGSRGITVQTELSVHSTNEGQAPVGNGHSYSHFPPPV